MLRLYKLKDYNFRLILWILALSVIGVLLVGSADASLQMHQVLGILLGIGLMVVFSLIDFSWILNFYWILYVATLGLLFLVLVIGWSTNGAQRWIDLGFVRFQPVELAKILLILFFARYFMKHAHELNKPRIMIRIAALIGLPLALIFVEPDLKNTITFTAVFCIMYFVAGLSYRFIIVVLAILIPVGTIFISIVKQPDQTLLQDYQRNRIMAFIYPDKEEYKDNNTQQNNSVNAIGSGQLMGKGLNNSDVSSANKGNFIPEIQTDFIFAVAGEEIGFLGSSGIIILLLLVVMECLYVSRRAKDLSGVIICTGVAAVIAFQSFINIGVATGLLPNTGTPLPFVSYGLSSLESQFIGIGIVLNVGLQSKVRLSNVRREQNKRHTRKLNRRYDRRRD
ncbi:MAG: FtsW/RodA/SpoVE family cell cycle protein [Lachnospiraceae bacterium]|nr:FtsW/RodA/SpoVE family cell cycle protein [Lachnospiraceae bacterium]